METVVNVDEEIQKYVGQLSDTRKKSLLKLIKFFAEEEDLKPQTIEEYNKELEEAVVEVEAGNFYTHEQVKEMMKNW